MESWVGMRSPPRAWVLPAPLWEATSSGLCQWDPLPLYSSPDTSCCQSLVSLRTMLAVTKRKQEKAQSSTKPTQKKVWRKGDLCLLTVRSEGQLGVLRQRYTRKAGMTCWMPVPA